jgi:hypothetical protein
MSTDPVQAGRPHDPENRYRLYIDESGDHVFRDLEEAGHRYLCLLGCWFRGADYHVFHARLERFKQRHIPHNPDEPVVLHREDIINRRRAFWRLRDEERATVFDRDLLELLAQAAFRVVAVVIDKKALQERYPVPAHPYHLGLGFLLQRYCGFLNHINRCGDVMAESRGGREDRLLKDSYARVYQRGVWMTRAEFFQHALSSTQLKLKPKSANIAGLQLADLLGNPVRQAILRERARIDTGASGFATRLLDVAEQKFNRHLYDGRVWGYGKVLFPE